jgi:tripartite-type tricarboxylate transporter receptor subunit TctC
MSMLHRRDLLGAALGAAAAAGVLARPALAQGDWPTKPVRIIVPFPPGGSTDVLTRLYAERLGGILGQPFVVENRPGAGGNIGAEAVAKAAPDGYTLGAVTVSIMAINQFLYRRMPFDAAKDLAPVALAWELPNVAVVVPERVPASTLSGFLSWAKAQRKGVLYGSTGIGQTTHLSSALLFERTGIDATHVPYRGASQTIPSLLSGDVNFALDNLASYITLIQEGRMRALAVTSAERWPTLPDVPTMAEAGMPDFVVTVWGALVAPAQTPKPIVEKLNGAMRQIAADAAVQERFLQGGARAAWSTPEDAAARAAGERPKWQEMVRISGAQAD